MKHAELKARVAAAEQQLERHLHNVGAQNAELQHSVRASITPARILAAGVLTGFAIGWVRPLNGVSKTAALVQVLRAVPGWSATLEPWLALLQTLPVRRR